LVFNLLSSLYIPVINPLSNEYLSKIFLPFCRPSLHSVDNFFCHAESL
jgi:hypothetical protein